jgi:hypothetical protein
MSLIRETQVRGSKKISFDNILYCFRSHMVVDNEKVLPILKVHNKRLRLHEEHLSWKVKTLKAYYLKAIETGKLAYSG